MNPLVSIIVPVYNVELYIENCLKSLKNQNYKHIEVIMINDGSNDKSEEICNSYSQKDSRFILHNKSNGGLSDARNVGLIMSKGKYILFVDGDDFINNGHLENMVEISERNNLEVFSGNGHIVLNESRKKKWIVNNYNENKIYSGIEYMVEGMKKGYFSAAVCSRLYLKSFLISNKIKFKENILHEDENWTPRVLLKTTRLMHKDLYFYNYMFRSDSITRKKNKLKNIIDLQNTCLELEKIYKKHIDGGMEKKYCLDYLARMYMVSCNLDKAYSLKREDIKFIDKNTFIAKTKLKKKIFLNFRPVYSWLRVLKGS